MQYIVILESKYQIFDNDFYMYNQILFKWKTAVYKTYPKG